MLIGQNVKRHGGLFYLTSPELEQLPIPDGPPSPGSEYER
jgi:hypothetical protein